MYAQFFGNYLLTRKIITKEQLIHAMERKSSQRMRLGTLAIHAGYMTAGEVDKIVILQTHQDKHFGELAVQEGYLTQEQLTELLKAQKPDFLLLGQVLVEDGILDGEQLQDAIIAYQSETEINDYDYSEDAKDTVQRLLENFFSVVGHPLSRHELIYIRLLYNNLVRFIGDDFTLATPYLIGEYPPNYCVSQRVRGKFSSRIYIDMEKDACVDFASRYAREEFHSFDEYVQASLEDFLNLHNGLFVVNLSNDYGVELRLEPPAIEARELITLADETYILPVIFPFGMFHVIIEVLPGE